MPVRLALVLLVLLAAPGRPQAGQGPVAPSAGSTVAPHVTYITPIWGGFSSASEADVAANVALLRDRIGEGGGVKLGFAEYVHVQMDDWGVDITSPAAIRRALGSFESQVDDGLRRARAHNIVFAITMLTAIRDRTDPAQQASFEADRRVMQWYSNNVVADGWWTHSRYARRQYAVQRAYMQEIAKILASRAAQYPETFVGIAGDGEVELANVLPGLADYSPFAVAEFRDWLRGDGLYAPGAEFAADAYEFAARYRGDAAPGLDTNKDGHTLNLDMGTQFDTWDLRFFPWSLADDERSDPQAIPRSVYDAPGFNAMPGGADHAFDPPRVWDATDPWCQLWNQFRQRMIWHHNRDLAQWMTTTPDDEGRRLPASRWFSYQIPSDYVFGSSPDQPSDRLLTSASPWWTANVVPHGGLGFTAFGARHGTNTYQRTLPGLVGGVRSCGTGAPAPPGCLANPNGLAGTSWGLFEWNPVVPLSPGTSSDRFLALRSDRVASRSAALAADVPPPEPTDLAIYRDEMLRLRRYRPTILAPFLWGDTAEYRILNTGFETAMREFATAVRDGWTPTIGANPATLHAAVTRVNGAVTNRSAAQVVYVSQPTGGTSDWQVTTNTPWIAVGSPAGHGDGSLTINVDQTVAGALPAGRYEGAATLVSPGAVPEQLTITVSLTVFDETQTQAPFGLVDTPLPDTTGVVGAIGVTGWALDDVGVAGVRIYRNCLSFEPELNCATIHGERVVFLGDATFVSGARPDVEASYPTAPQAYRAGWGYLLLTNMLPHIPRGQMFGGEGTLTLYALARDLDGHQTWLGRSTADSMPTTITLANDMIAKPFGAIDTPQQGETIGGRFANFGWVLTPDTDSDTGDDDILVPTTGSTIWVWVDGVPLAPISHYNLCRGTVGSPVPQRDYCNDDVANIFGQATPQPTFTRRTENATPHRNLDAGRGAMGAYFLDTSSLGNGVHSIVWSAADSAGREEGIGSRYFTVLNTVAADSAPGSKDPGLHSVARGFSPARDGRTDVLHMSGRTGFDVHAPLVEVPADADGVRHVRIPELGRVELWLGPVDAGYLVMPDSTLRDLPIGSNLDAALGRFTWAPGPGFIGTYHLLFVRDGLQVPVDMTIEPARPAGQKHDGVRMYLDTPVSGAVVAPGFLVAGWALDPEAAIGSGIGAVHVWAQRTGSDPVFLGEAVLGVARPDVAAVHGAGFHAAGFGLVAPALPPGEYQVMVFAWSTRTGRWEDIRTATVQVRGTGL